MRREPMMSEKKVIEAENLTKYFPLSKGFSEMLFSRKLTAVHAVDGITFDIREKEVFGLAGESGSGKTTTGRLLLKLIEPTKGKLIFKGKNIATLKEKELKPLRRRMQIIFQDPYESLNPRMTISDILAEPLMVQGITHNRSEIREKAREMLESVELTPPDEFLLRYPHELSGGQRQRVAVARAFILNPEFVVADEPVSMLDVSIRAEVLNLMLDLVGKFNVSFLYITHDLALARHMCDRLAVMYLGKIVEMGPVEKIVYEPLHPYTNALIDAVPTPDPTQKRSRTVLSGEIPSAINPPLGCRFHTRCPVVMDICSKEEPAIVDIDSEHSVACHRHK
jgi:oligopeptide/dipeptide ABC transporter ATP-binding protein